MHCTAMRCGWRSQRRVLSPFSLSCSHWRIGQGRCRERARQRQAWMAKPMGKILEVHTVREWKEGCERDFGVLLEWFTWQHGIIRAVHGERDAERGCGSKSLPPSFLSSARQKMACAAAPSQHRHLRFSRLRQPPIPHLGCLHPWGSFNKH